MTDVLQIEALSAIRTSGDPVLQDISLRVATGEIHGLVGESGAGKSTVAKAVLGALPHGIRVSGGAVRYLNRNLFNLSSKAMRGFLGSEIAFIPQDPLGALNPSRRIGAQLCDGLISKGHLSHKTARLRAAELLEEVQIGETERVLSSYPHELSGGMRQRVLIASAFSLRPKLIIADEPTTALDVTVQKQILKLLRQLQRNHNVAILFVSHDLGVVAKLCDQLTVLCDGVMVEQGTVASVFEVQTHPYTARLIASAPRYDRPTLLSGSAYGSPE